VRSLKAHPPLDRKAPTLLPGERSHEARKNILRQGVPLSPQTLRGLNEWAARLKVRA